MKLFGTTFEPMLLEEEKNAFNSKEYLYEIKFDGMRALIYASPKVFKIYNRHKKEITHLFPELKNIQKMVTKPVIFDGEITSFKKSLPSFQELQKRIHLKTESKIKSASLKNPVLFLCFDILYENKSLVKKTLLERKKILEKYTDTEEFVKTMYVLEKGQELFKKVKKLGLEGIVAKKISSPYEVNTRNDNWLKIKNLKTDSFFIGGYKEGKSTSMFSVYIGKEKKDKLMYVGKVSVPRKSGLLNILKKEKKYQSSPFQNYKEEKVNYIKTNYSCYVEYLEKSKEGILRHPVFIGFES